MNSASFISELTDRVLQENPDGLDKVTVIFPNRRAGLFFRKAMAERIDKPIWMPEVVSMEDFLKQFTSYQKMETLEAVFELFDDYKRLQKNKETFDQFFFWGEMILRDFEEIDQYMVNTKHLFTNIKTQKELDEEFFFLDEEDKKIIQSFWSSFLPDTTETQKLFLETWKILLPLYESYKEKLIAQGRAYNGMIYRDIAERTEEGTITTDRSIYFAGFNALTATEEKIIKHFVHEYKAHVVWDLDDYYFTNRNQEAGYFLRTYAKDSILGKTFPTEPPNRYKAAKKFTATGVSLEVGQAKALAESLEKAAQEPDFETGKTVVVLPQEHMLFPTLHAIPDAIDKINITMGYPLKDTPVYSLVESVLVLHHMRKEDLINGISYYYKPLKELLEHPLLFKLEEKKITELIGIIKKRNVIMLYEDDLHFENPLLQFIFKKNSDPIQFLSELLEGLYKSWKDDIHGLELEFIARFYKQVQQLQTMMGEKASTLSYDFVVKLFRRLSRSFKVPFTGEPLEGLQVMGILETRNLDFDRVYILNMNEDSWPAAPRRGSFIPYNIRRAFDLPVYDHSDSIYAYLFYRLIQRANEIHFFYNTVAEFNVNGELSRLVQQLEVESGYTIEKRILAGPIKTKAPDAITIEKNADVLQKMERFLVGYEERDKSRFTPSALNIYLECRLRFYFKYVEKLYEPDEVQEEMDPMIFGNILHNSMEILYKAFIKKEKRDIVHQQDIFWIKEGVNGALNEAFKEHYNVKGKKKFKLEGRSLIAADVLRKFMLKILDHDASYAPFKIIGLEAGFRDGYSIEYPITVGERDIKIRMHGIIDRIDLKEGKVRVIDYKTGRDKKNFTTLESLTDREDKNRNKAVFQVFFYSYLYWKKYADGTDAIEPGLFNSLDLFQKEFNWQIVKDKDFNIKDFRQYTEAYEEQLGQLLHEIYDPSHPFDQTEDVKKCEYCAYREICGR
ncbi:MAG TPA: PD-(D/E)XK nuclease family protein [Fulvivirga sp.]|nr:PD-(D/E)XK nuclease family protein [Fulvivirga sp.]